MEKLYKLSNKNYLFVQALTDDNGWDYYYLDGTTRRALDGGILETDDCEWDTPITDTLIRTILGCFEGTKFEKELQNITFKEDKSLNFWDDFEA